MTYIAVKGKNGTRTDVRAEMVLRVGADLVLADKHGDVVERYKASDVASVEKITRRVLWPNLEAA